MAGVWNDANATLKDLTQVFDEARAQVKEINYTKYASKVQSDGAYEKYPWMTAVPLC